MVTNGCTTGVSPTVSLRKPGAGFPELLAPAGTWDCARAAVENGADAIYFGLEEHNARLRAGNFTTADLPGLMEFLHRRGVRGYVCVNTLVFPDELAGATELLRAVIRAGVDAALIQDVGVARLIRRLSPDFPIHASTQMSITSAAGVEFAHELGCTLAVLSRECTVKEIARLQQEVRAGAGLPLEVFVHGALCVAYSGQCLTSEALGGRSANRGECAQACRMPYELVADGVSVDLGDRRYLLSPQDLVGLEWLPDLVRAGVASLKIEGRLKTPEYVANITRVYRQAIDRVVAELAAASPVEGSTDRAQSVASGVMRESRYNLEMAFSRGLYTGWLGGINNQALVHGRFGKKRGVYLGEVTRVLEREVWVRLESGLKPGDGIVFDAGRPDLDEEGGRVYSVNPPGASAQADERVLRFGDGSVDFGRVHPGDKVWKTSDPALERQLRQSYAAAEPQYQRPIEVEVRGRAGEPLRLEVRDEAGRRVNAVSAMPLAAAERQPLSTERLREQLGRLGGTPYRLGDLANRLEGAVLVPVSELNRLRRQVVAELDGRRSAPPRWALVDHPAPWAIDGDAAVVSAPVSEAELIPMVRTRAQLEAALQCGASTIYCELEDPKRYREFVRRVRASSGCAGPARSLWVAPPRIHKPGDAWILKQVRSCDADGYLVRNYDDLRFFSGLRRRGDFSLNVANGLAAEHFIRHHGLERLTASYDLNHAELEALLRSAPPAWFEITIHQHMPMFHMEHCVFCAFLSKGTDYTNCGRPCDRQEVALRDRVGAVHPVKADAGCRNTVFSASAQTGAEHVGKFLGLGTRHFRVEFVGETAEQVVRTLTRYRQLIRGEITGSQLWKELKLQNQLGVTRGPMG